MRTIYRLLKNRVLDEAILSMKGKQKLNGHQKYRGNQVFKRSISEWEHDYPWFQKESKHIEDDNIVRTRHKSEGITLVERLTKVIIALKLAGRRTRDIEVALDQ